MRLFFQTVISVAWALTGVFNPAIAQVAGNSGFEPGGDDVIVPTNTFARQDDAVIARLTDGGYVIAWDSMAPVQPNSWGLAVRAQRFDTNNAAAGTEFLVNLTTVGSQSVTGAAGLTNGGFVVGFTDESQTILSPTNRVVIAAVRLFDATGAAVGNDIRLTDALIREFADVQLAALPGGGFVTAIIGEPVSGDGAGTNSLYIQRFDDTATALATPVLVRPTILSASIASFSDGRFIVTWIEDADAGGGRDLEAWSLLFNVDGTTNGNAFRIVSHNADMQDEIQVAVLSDGKFVVAWSDTVIDNLALLDPHDIRVQIFNGDGTLVGSPFLANNVSDGDQQSPSLAPLDGGGFIVS